jgi:CBS domain-containing protein
MSPRAAVRLEELGFAEVYDYTAGKVDWLARGLPTDGDGPPDRRAGSAVSDEVVTCTPEDPVGPVAERIRRSPFGFALVVSASGVLLGRLPGSALEDEPARPAEEVIEPGPSTVRAHEPLEPLLARLAERNLRTAIVTDPDGRLIAVVRR